MTNKYEHDGDLPEPEDNESKDAFVKRCISELVSNGVAKRDAQIACEFQWEDFTE